MNGPGKDRKPLGSTQKPNESTTQARLANTQKNMEARLNALERGRGTNTMSQQGTSVNPNVRGSTMSRDSAMTQTRGAYGSAARRIMQETQEVIVQGGSLRTWSYPSPMVENVQVVLATEGRPMDADVELWQGPDNTPVKMRVYVEDGSIRPFSTIIETPRGPNTISVRNIGQIEFPLAAYVSANVDDSAAKMMASQRLSSMTIQGGALRTFPFDPSVDSVAVMLKTDGRPLNARIELLQGPNNNKQVIELYTEDGMDRPFFCVIASPGSGNVVRIVNTAPVEFPMTAVVEANEINYSYSPMDPVLGGDSGGFVNRSSRF